MNGPIDLARKWQKADSDLAAAAQVVAGEGPYDTACFHAQQAIEKSLQAVLAYRGEEIPRTHNLAYLASAATNAVDSLKLDPEKLRGITAYAVELRYDPGFWPERETAVEALAIAQTSASSLPPRCRAPEFQRSSARCLQWALALKPGHAEARRTLVLIKPSPDHPAG